MKTRNIYKIRSNRTYSTKDLASLLDVHVRTVQTWIPKGLKVLNTGSSPLYLKGEDVKEFLYKRNQNKKCKLKKSEMYCVSCKAPRVPDTNLRVEPNPTGITYADGNKLIILKGVCPICGSTMNKFKKEKV